MTDLHLYTANCPACQGWFSLAEPVSKESKALLVARLLACRNVEARCPYCGAGRRLEELTQRRWLTCTEEPEP